MPRWTVSWSSKMTIAEWTSRIQFTTPSTVRTRTPNTTCFCRRNKTRTLQAQIHSAVEILFGTAWQDLSKMTHKSRHPMKWLFCFVLFCFVLFCFVLFCLVFQLWVAFLLNARSCNGEVYARGARKRCVYCVYVRWYTTVSTTYIAQYTMVTLVLSYLILYSMILYCIYVPFLALVVCTSARSVLLYAEFLTSS